METSHLLQALKRALRTAGVSYRDAAAALDLSESSIKRLFAEQGFTLPRLEKLCELAGTDLLTLLQQARQTEPRLQSLTVAQEQEIVASPQLLLVGVCLVNQMSFDEIRERYRFSEPELIRCFAQYDRWGAIDYLPGNRYRLMLSRNFTWQPGGPIQRFFLQTILNDFVTSAPPGESDHLHFSWGLLTAESARELTRRIRRLIEDYQQMAAEQAQLSMHDKATTSMLVLFRENWEPEVFRPHWREQGG